jgi:hypothetical protein
MSGGRNIMKRVMVGGVAALALLGSGLAFAGGTSVASGAPDEVGRSSSTDGAAAGSVALGSSRLREGQALRRDPNSLTRSEAAAMEARQQRILDRSGLATSARPNGSVTIPIEFHSIGTRQGEGFVSKKRVRAQVRVLNRAFAGRTSPRAANTPFRFRINSIDRTRNTGWYNASIFNKEGRIQHREMRRELHVGNARHLNMYTVGPKFQLLGYATLPSGKQPKLDAVVMWNASLPGGAGNLGPGSVYNRGDTGTHEVGHWLNLYHTFTGSCGRLNDYVTDTPRQRAAATVFEEDPTLDTCKPHGPKTRDPVRNFMNYTDDPFMDNFTRGQRDRMNTAWYIRLALAQSD